MQIKEAAKVYYGYNLVTDCRIANQGDKVARVCRDDDHPLLGRTA
jgi:hypothetical protein